MVMILGFILVFVITAIKVKNEPPMTQAEREAKHKQEEKDLLLLVILDSISKK